MSFESEKFSFGEVDWIYVASREISSDPKLPVRTGIKAVAATCRICSHTWRATQYGNGKLHSVLGGVIVTCPSCGAEENVSIRHFEA